MVDMNARMFSPRLGRFLHRMVSSATRWIDATTIPSRTFGTSLYASPTQRVSCRVIHAAPIRIPKAQLALGKACSSPAARAVKARATWTAPECAVQLRELSGGYWMVNHFGYWQYNFQYLDSKLGHVVGSRLGGPAAGYSTGGGGPTQSQRAAMEASAKADAMRDGCGRPEPGSQRPYRERATYRCQWQLDSAAGFRIQGLSLGPDGLPRRDGARLQARRPPRAGRGRGRSLLESRTMGGRDKEDDGSGRQVGADSTRRKVELGRRDRCGKPWRREYGRGPSCRSQMGGLFIGVP